MCAQVREVSLLLALMCKYSCEESELVLHDGESCCSVQLQKGTILDNLQHLLNTSISQMSSAEPLQTWDDRKVSTFKLSNLSCFIF